MLSAGGGLEKQHPAKRAEGLGVYWHGLVDKPFKTSLQYFFNPSIPYELLYPSGIHSGRWLPDSDILRLSPPLWERVDSLSSTPLSLRGMEQEEITPDDFSGTYYAYRQDRLLLMFRYRDLPMLLALAWQNGDSSKARRGGFLGPYDNWDFVFTKESGGTAPGLGWLSMYMYASSAIILYFPLDDEHTGISILKWLKAGWAGLNVVERRHILSGANRNYSGMVQVVRADGGLSVAELEAIARKVDAADAEAICADLEAYALELARRSRTAEVLKRGEFQKLLYGGNYAHRISEDNLRSLYLLILLKRGLGKPVLGEGE
jgi:hypothetical protein